MPAYENLRLVKLELKKWTGTIKDKKTQQELAEQKGAKTDQVHVTKTLVAKEHKKAYDKAYSELYTFHRKFTCKYTYKGWSILNGSEWHTYSQKVSELKLVILEAVEFFLENWDDIVSEIPSLLGGLYDPDEIPSKDTVASKFRVRVYVEPFPKEQSFYGLGLTEEEVKEQMDYVQEGIKIAVRDVWERMYEKVKLMIDNLKKGEELKRWHKSMAINIEEIVDLLPALNITNDPNLTIMGEELKKSLCAFSVETLKENKRVREHVIEKGEEQMKIMESFMGQLPKLESIEEAA